MHGVTLMIRTAGGVDVTGAVRREISAMDANLTPFDTRRMPEQIERLMSLVRLAMKIYGSIVVFGLILASVGLAGVTAYSVTRRGHEIGIRIALGAGRGDVLRLVMKGRGSPAFHPDRPLCLRHQRQHLRPRWPAFRSCSPL
jgi:predicted lysophospholipase L1 biosynthesis ABC-type transport system permease subunit